MMCDLQILHRPWRLLALLSSVAPTAFFVAANLRASFDAARKEGLFGPHLLPTNAMRSSPGGLLRFLIDLDGSEIGALPDSWLDSLAYSVMKHAPSTMTTILGSVEVDRDGRDRLGGFEHHPGTGAVELRLARPHISKADGGDANSQGTQDRATLARLDLQQPLCGLGPGSKLQQVYFRESSPADSTLITHGILCDGVALTPAKILTTSDCVRKLAGLPLEDDQSRLGSSLHFEHDEYAFKQNVHIAQFPSTSVTRHLQNVLAGDRFRVYQRRGLITQDRIAVIELAKQLPLSLAASPCFAVDRTDVASLLVPAGEGAASSAASSRAENGNGAGPIAYQRVAAGVPYRNTVFDATTFCTGLPASACTATDVAALLCELARKEAVSGVTSGSTTGSSSSTAEFCVAKPFPGQGSVFRCSNLDTEEGCLSYQCRWSVDESEAGVNASSAAGSSFCAPPQTPALALTLPLLPAWDRIVARETVGITPVCALPASVAASATTSSSNTAQQSSNATDQAAYDCLRGERVFTCEFHAATRECRLKSLGSAEEEVALVQSYHFVSDTAARDKLCGESEPTFLAGATPWLVPLPRNPAVLFVAGWTWKCDVAAAAQSSGRRLLTPAAPPQELDWIFLRENAWLREHTVRGGTPTATNATSSDVQEPTAQPHQAAIVPLQFSLPIEIVSDEGLLQRTSIEVVNALGQNVGEAYSGSDLVAFVLANKVPERGNLEQPGVGMAAMAVLVLIGLLVLFCVLAFFFYCCYMRPKEEDEGEDHASSSTAGKSENDHVSGCEEGELREDGKSSVGENFYPEEYYAELNRGASGVELGHIADHAGAGGVDQYVFGYGEQGQCSAFPPPPEFGFDGPAPCDEFCLVDDYGVPLYVRPETAEHADHSWGNRGPAAVGPVAPPPSRVEVGQRLVEEAPPMQPLDAASSAGPPSVFDCVPTSTPTFSTHVKGLGAGQVPMIVRSREGGFDGINPAVRLAASSPERPVQRRTAPAMTRTGGAMYRVQQPTKAVLTEALQCPPLTTGTGTTDVINHNATGATTSAVPVPLVAVDERTSVQTVFEDAEQLHRLASEWYYRDRSGKVQGPFSTSRMRKWWEAGKLSRSLCVRSAASPTGKNFVPICEMFADNVEGAFAV